MPHRPETRAQNNYRIAGIFHGGKFSWMLKLLLVRRKNFVVESSLVTV